MDATILLQQRASDSSSAISFIPPMNLAHFPDIIATLSESGSIKYINKAGEELFGYQAAELREKNILSYAFADDISKARSYIDQVRTQGTITNFIFRFLKKDQTVCYISWSANWSENDRLIFSIGRDITTLMENQQKQIANEHLFQALIDNSFDLLALTDEKGKYLYVSDTFNNSFGYVPDDLLGTNCFDYMHPDDLPRLLNQFQQLFEHDKKIHVPPYRFRNAKGEWLWMEAIVTNQLNHPDIKGIVVSVRDINQQYHTENKLKEMQLLQALVQGEEKERSRIARDLHDGISGMIAAAKMHVASLSIQFPAVAQTKEYKHGIDLLDTAAIQVRRTSHNLMPEIVLEKGLSQALSRYCHSISNDQLTVTFIATGLPHRYIATFELLLYRIVQELLNNIIKHAKATEAFVQIREQSRLLTLTIEDNGIGFNEKDLTEGTGLSSIKKRIEKMNGCIDISTAPGRGTCIFIEFIS
jgi:PAS domain S-box-containing protein